MKLYKKQTVVCWHLPPCTEGLDKCQICSMFSSLVSIFNDLFKNVHVEQLDIRLKLRQNVSHISG